MTANASATGATALPRYDANRPGEEKPELALAKRR